ncbi:LuxR family transcriptional regulator [Streptomyces alkaliphilus]|uniref:LuxR family transcriptional regulator n=1 Tax=Streptomyces alkaliphilus TaxID=1472722 RepID=A0A7W3Y1H5_9ACTN|nr:LuxR family transcriptional regulator [Streptomyces alkaliphilus]MBB0244317.1 LuxR family transcriptional regulator [Streptomyces alkaliphilus]
MRETDAVERPSTGRARDHRLPPEERGDELEQAMLEIRGRIEDLVVRHRSLLSSLDLVSEVDGDTLTTSLRELVTRAEHRVDMVVSTDSAQAAAMAAMLRRRLECRDAPLEVRLLCGRHTLDEVISCREAPGWSGAIRVARMSTVAAMIVDERVALLHTDSTTGSRASLVRAPGVINSLHTLFRGVWRNAVPLPEGELGFGGRERTETVRRILEQLQLGVTDEVAARDLAVSVRTYRRYVSEIMRVLGATSRFQAGVRAAELGLAPRSETTPSVLVPRQGRQSA